MGERGGVAKFDGAWPNDSAQREQVQGFFLLRACLPVVSPSCQWHGSISCGASAALTSSALHPKHFPEIFIDASGVVAMGASRKQCRVFRGKRRAKDYLVDVSAAGCAGFPSDLPSNCSDFPNLFLHLLPPCPGPSLVSLPDVRVVHVRRRTCGVRIGETAWTGNTVEVGAH